MKSLAADHRCIPDIAAYDHRTAGSRVTRLADSRLTGDLSSVLRPEVGSMRIMEKKVVLAQEATIRCVLTAEEQVKIAVD